MDNGYMEDWSPEDMVMFNKYVIDETNVICLWVNNGAFCNDSIKAKDCKFHLHHTHGITSEYDLYQCHWHECSTPPMKRSSLERHMKEQHIPAKWACPFCPETFSRDSTMKEHMRRAHGHA